MSDENSRYLKRRRKRRATVGKLLTRLEKAPDARERAKIIDKIWKVNPMVLPKDATK